MELVNYKEYLLPTVAVYNKRTQDYLINKLIEKKIIIDEEIDKKDKIKPSIKQSENMIIAAIEEIGIPAIKILEEWEFIRDYQYSVLYKTHLLKKEEILDKIESAQLKTFSTESKELEEINTIICNPTVYIGEDIIILKFALGKKCINPDTTEEKKYKYSINTVIHLNTQLIEVRYNPINGLFIDDYKGFYKKNLSAVKAWMNKYLGIKMDKFIIDPIIDKLKKDTDLRLEGQDMRFSDGSKACLEVGSNITYTLPLLGELINIMQENQDEFDKAIAIKQILETWITSKEDEADYNWVCICWPDENKRKTYDVKVRFHYDYFGEGESLLYHYSGPIGMERMNHVVQTIVKYL